MNKLPKIIAVVGMTASGKTDLAIKLAKEFNGEIISVDSRQIYKEMNIGTAKEPGVIKNRKQGGGHWGIDLPADCPVSVEEVLDEYYEVDGIPHYMIDVVYPDQVLTLAHFQALSFGIIKEILSRGKLPILVGWTGLYTTAIVENWQIPEIEPDKNLRNELEELTDIELMKRLELVNPEKIKTIDLQNRRRLIRAIEIASQGRINKSPSKLEPKYDVLHLAPEMSKEEVYDRINKRVDIMVEQGLVEEVKNIGKKYGYDNVSMTGQGYKQIGLYHQGTWDLDFAIEETKKVTRHYAKRQLTWWRKHGPVEWVKSSDDAFEKVREFLTK